MTPCPFKKFERYPTREGGEALILAVFDSHIVAAHYSSSGAFITAELRHNPDGRHAYTEMSGFDILPPPPQTETGWVNVFRHEDGTIWATGIHESRAIADATAERTIRLGFPYGRVGCHRVEIRAEFKEE